MSELQDLAERAINILQSEPGIKVSEAVSKAVTGAGLSREGLHRVSTMVNREMLSRDTSEKRSSGKPIWTSRWETSKPEALLGTKTSENSAYATRTTTGPDEDPRGDSRIGSLGSPGRNTEDALDFQYHSLRKLVRQVAGNHQAGDGVVEGGSEGEDDDEDVAPIHPETREEYQQQSTPIDKQSSVDPFDVAPSYGLTKQSQDQSEERFALLSNFFVSPEVRAQQGEMSKASSIREDATYNVNQVDDSVEQLRTALEDLSVLKTSTAIRLQGAKAGLHEAIDEAVEAGLTLGESLQFVKLAGLHPLVSDISDDSRFQGWYLDVVSEALDRHDVDIDAALGNAYDSAGHQKVSAIRRAQAMIDIRPQVLPAPEDPESIVDIEAPLIKASRAYYDLMEQTDALDVAMDEGRRLFDQARDGLVEAYSIRSELTSYPDSILASMSDD